jgi:lysozyme family protein
MQHPFEILRPEYEHLLSTVKITRPQVVSRGVDEIERVLASYEDTGAVTDIPPGWIGPTDCRESDCNPRCGIGQGDPWNRISVHVPRGEGPFASKATADEFYLHYDHIDAAPPGGAWTLAWAVFCWEAWNGWGPRNHGRLSGYPWACTDAYDTPAYGGHGLGGKYVEDGVWDAGKLDPQPGAVALYMELVRRHPSLVIAGAPLVAVVAPPLVPAPPPVGIHDGEALQAALNKLGANPQLDVDGNFGRMTARAVRAFQAKAGLAVDGLAGPATWAAINARLPATGSA